LRFSTKEYMQPPHGFCPGCGVALTLRYFLKAMGGNVVLVMPPGCTSPSVLNPKRSLVSGDRYIDVICSPFGSTAIFAGGIKSGLVARGDLKTQVVAWAGDGATFDIGLSGVSGAAERNEDIIYVCNDNEAYMNTGNQRSSATPIGATTTTNPPPGTKHESKKDIMWIMMGHQIPYAATSTIAYPDDLMGKVRKAKDIKGFRFFHFLAPCVPGWGFRTEQTVKLSRFAVQTGLFPLYEMENGAVSINKKRKSVKLEEFTKLQRRYKFLGKEGLAALEGFVDQQWNRLNRLAGTDGDAVSS